MEKEEEEKDKEGSKDENGHLPHTHSKLREILHA